MNRSQHSMNTGTLIALYDRVENICNHKIHALWECVYVKNVVLESGQRVDVCVCVFTHASWKIMNTFNIKWSYIYIWVKSEFLTVEAMQISFVVERCVLTTNHMGPYG